MNPMRPQELKFQSFFGLSYFRPPGRPQLEREPNFQRFSCFSLVFWASGKAKTRARASIMSLK